MIMQSLAAGTVIGSDFVIERLVGEGGMGAVYLARQRSTNRLRAIKVLAGAVVSDPRSRERFAREAMAGSLIASEHVVEVIAAGVDESLGHTPWLAMEYLDGQELTDYVADQSDRVVPRPHAHMVLEQVFHALSAAHRAGVVHRDIKPQNVFLANARMVGVPFVVKVLDFGIAKMVSETHPPSQTTSLGTPGWMAPEQIEQGQAAPGADVWALGLLTFYVLTGAKFWPRNNQENVSIQTLLYEMMMAPIPPASERAGEYGRAHLLPSGFDAWFGTCLVRDPAKRCPDAGAAWATLQGVLGGSPEGEAAVSTVYMAPSTAGSAPPAGISGTEPWSPGAGPEAGPSVPQPAVPTATAPASNTTLSAHGAWSPKTGTDPAVESPSSKRRLVIWSSAGLLGIAAVVGTVWALRSEPPASPPPKMPDPVRSSPTASSAPVRTTPPTEIFLPQTAFSLFGKQVHVGGLLVDRAEVTVGQWQACVDVGACDSEVGSVNVPGAAAWSVLCNWPRRTERKQHPMNCVSRYQAAAYCKWSGKRLPTGAEWYRAAYVSNGHERRYPWGDDFPTPGAAYPVNLCDSECASMLRASRLSKGKEPLAGLADGYADTGPAGSFLGDRTPVGILGMGGNVMEWTSTDHDDGRALCRGGHWLANRPRDASSEAMYAVAPGDRRANLGLRCVRSQENGSREP